MLEIGRKVHHLFLIRVTCQWPEKSEGTKLFKYLHMYTDEQHINFEHLIYFVALLRLSTFLKFHLSTKLLS